MLVLFCPNSLYVILTFVGFDNLINTYIIMSIHIYGSCGVFLVFHSVAADEEIHLHNLQKGDVPINVQARWQQGSKFHGLIRYCSVLN